MIWFIAPVGVLGICYVVAKERGSEQPMTAALKVLGGLFLGVFALFLTVWLSTVWPDDVWSWLKDVYHNHPTFFGGLFAIGYLALWGYQAWEGWRKS